MSAKPNFPVGQFLRECDAIRDGALDGLNLESIAMIAGYAERLHQYLHELHTDKFVQRQLSGGRSSHNCLTAATVSPTTPAGSFTQRN